MNRYNGERFVIIRLYRAANKIPFEKFKFTINPFILGGEHDLINNLSLTNTAVLNL